MRLIVICLLIAAAAVAVVDRRTLADVKEEVAPAYAGAASCLCHADPIQKSWQKSKHARAFELLRLAGQEKNEKCLPCHTTGYGQGGYGTPGLSVNLEGVQCEECHGPAGGHVSTMDKTKISRTPSAAVCARCHMDTAIHETP